ncbi:hypothetical protein PPL_06029 [Heterostelium album PN500]|uniref:PH domain-containing protein n=1 Tax=Heterostelium pallidum (strain ATCC 26659 / Pp 5 / PN500) TaxID=670386 RepID=D3BC09_HETP5|nr:hypothetical protein PPL_06029 [Heterostelium album PN500]EFA81192.1 hypothetical protein PPL_06029 [Heterostelium album PN500]|eukprot:XP_020433310.1 hypothetical protein PPL_06029 [Heterostelium album PN500]
MAYNGSGNKDRMFSPRDNIKYPSGFLTKQGGFYKNWKKRFFIIKHNVITYYKSELDKVSCGFFLLDDVEVVIKDTKTFTFVIRPVGKLKKVKAYKLDANDIVVLIQFALQTLTSILS